MDGETTLCAPPAVRTITLEFDRIADAAGYRKGPDGRFALPAETATAVALGRAAADLLPRWKPGDGPAPEVVLTGAGPIWAYLRIGHELHGVASRLVYAAPNAPEIEIFRHKP